MVLPGEGTVTSTRGGTLLADAAATGGTLGLIEGRMPPGRWVPAHLHRREAEAWYVLEGELTFRFGDRTVVAPAGAFVFSPLGVAHSFGNAGSGPRASSCSLSRAASRVPSSSGARWRRPCLR